MLIPGIIIPVLIIAASSYIIWKSTDTFELAADYLGRNMSMGVKGATLNAVASSMPEFLTTMFFLFYVKNEGQFADSFSGGLGVTAGSAVFNILIIPFAILFYGSFKLGDAKFPVNKPAVLRDGLFLIFVNMVLIFFIAQEEITSWGGLTLIVLYLLYLFVLRKGFGSGSSKKDQSSYKIEYKTIHAGHFLRLDFTRLLLNGKKLNTSLSWMALAVSTAVMSVGTWLLVEGTKMMGEEDYELFGLELHGLGVPIIFLSVLFAAAATSIPDTMISIRDARKGNHTDSISNALGSNIFDISFALGLPLFLYTLITGGSLSMSEEIRILSFGLWLLLFIINLAVLPVIYFSKNINRTAGIYFILLYILFIFVFEHHTGDPEISQLLEAVLKKLRI